MKRMALALTLIVAGLGIAQPQPQPEPPPQPQGQPGDVDGGDAPDRGVARISFMNGNVSVRRGDSGDMVAAALNTPVMVADRVVTADGGRAEVEFDSSNLVRLGPSTEVRFSDLQQGRYQLQIAAGMITFRVLRDSNSQVEISTPSISLHPLRTGIYRITVRPDGTSEITVRAGEAEIFGPRGSEQLQAGRTMLTRGLASDPEFQTVGMYPEDDFDHWGASRDREMQNSPSYRYVSPDVSGAEELDNHGRWVNDGSYGNVWVPQVDPGWAPYRCGRWVWTDFYGWTWVGCESWGWAPYHYGRWYMGSFGWAWWPGPIYPHCYWRPALVGFFGWGGGFGVGVGFGFGNVGWVPLAPFERFHPWYGRGYGGAIVNNVNITNVYRNARVANGVTSIRSGEFGRGSINNANFVRGSASEFARGGMVQGRLPLNPSADSRQFTNRSATAQGAPRTADNTRFFSRSQSQAGQTRSSAGTNSGWQRFDPASRSASPGQGSRSYAGSPSPSGSAGGWRRLDNGNQQSQAPSYNRSYTPQAQAPSRGYASQQPVRINPPIVQNRSGNSGNSGGRSTPASHSSGGSSHSSGGGSHGGGGGHH